MGYRRKKAAALCYILSILVIILDSKTACRGALDGIELCIKTVIPALFPLMLLSGAFTNAVSGAPIALLRPLQTICRIPDGAESLLISGLIGGYPVGAKCVYDRYRSGALSEADAKRLLCFCNNAGPAFIFGMCGSLFTHRRVCMALWLIHIASALLTGFCFSVHAVPSRAIGTPKKNTPSFSLESTLKAMGLICGWVVIFRVLLAFLEVWILWLFPDSLRPVLTGLLELTNGCCALAGFQTEVLRFLLCGIFLSFGGLCVTMQTAAVAPQLFDHRYLGAKALQALISLLLSLSVTPIIFPEESIIPGIVAASVLLFAGILIFFKFGVEIFRRLMYNAEKKLIRGVRHALPKEN